MNDTKFTKGEWYAHPNGVGCGGIAIVNTPNGCVIPKSEDIAKQLDIEFRVTGGNFITHEFYCTYQDFQTLIELANPYMKANKA